MQNNKLETGTGAQILGSSGGIRSIQPVLPRGGCPLIQLTEASERRRSTDEIPVSRCSQEERQRKKPIAYSRRDLGAAKYPPGAQRVPASPLPLSLSWANKNGAASVKARRRHCVNTLLCSQIHSRVSRYAETRCKRACKHFSF